MTAFRNWDRTRTASVYKLLTRARWLLLNVGWTQHAPALDENGEQRWLLNRPLNEAPVRLIGFCTYGAMQQAKQDTGMHGSARGLLLEIINERYPSPAGQTMANVARWNDEPKRTKEQVVEVFSEAIRRCKARLGPWWKFW